MATHRVKFMWSGIAASLIAALWAVGGRVPVLFAADPPAGAADQSALFEKSIEPLLSNRCSGCHNDAAASGGLSFDKRETLLRGGQSGPAIVPGKPEESLLVHRVLGDDPSKVRMPMGDDALSAAQIGDLKTWIAAGAPWPLKTVAASAPATAKGKVPYPRPATAEQLEYFEKKVRPIFVNRCYNCHSDAFKEAGGLRVDVGIAIFAGGNSGPVIIPGDPAASKLVMKIKATDPKVRMPQESKDPLPAEEIATLEKWIQDGAAWPDETEKLPNTPEKVLARYDSLRTTHWAWQPVTDPKVPSVANASWAYSDIDRFVLAGLAGKKLAPVKDADPVTLIRRVTYDLTGLPPTPAEVQAFEKDHSEKAYRELVERLLALPQYGERWGRHWLDVARYAESSGPSRNMPYPNAWRYRDYVIDAFNRDVPFDRFIKEQIAGDLLPAATPEDRDRQLIATGFLALGPKDVNQRFKARYQMDNVDDQLDTVTRSTMAITVTCARCHDHKFDPIPTKDYYALAGIFTSTEDGIGMTSRMGGSGLMYYAPKLLSYLSTSSSAPPVPKDEADRLKARTAELKAQADEAKKALESETTTEEQKKLAAKLDKEYRLAAVESTLFGDLGERGYGIHSVREGVVADTTVRVRGVEERHGPSVPRGVLSLINLPGQTAIPADHSGRLELAEWITRPDHPLTARVYANRVWQHLFGTGIVSTVDNFGSMGDLPSNQALLDYLARNLVGNGWSTKRLVREIVLSHAYRLGTDVPPGYLDVDPADHLIWRHAPRRLESEEVRDSLLASSGELDLDHPDGSPSMALRVIEIRDDGPTVGSILAAADRSRYRSVYLPLLRGETPRELAAFDPVVQTLVTGLRQTTTVPTQALFLLNSGFVRRESLVLAGRLLAEQLPGDGARITEAYERVLGRDPKPEEIAKATAFIARYSDKWSTVHPGAPASGIPLIPVAAASGITDGIVRFDGLTQDDEVLDSAPPSEDPALNLAPASAKHAAWGAFVQALYGSAEFQFVR
jgi:mono/diheme cytochrome c family protein